MEVSAITAGRAIARGDLVTALRASSVLSDRGDGEPLDLRVEEVAGQVSEQLADRARRSGESYPFRWDGGVLRRLSDWRSRSTYVFCLLLGRGDAPAERLKRSFPERLFEELCTDASARYLNGDAVRFGSPRTASDLPARFDLALESLCSDYLREGAPNAEVPHHTGDDGVDVVAWRSLDGRPTKLILFGNCASGADWSEKLRELQPGVFCNLHLASRPLDDPARAFFTPRALSSVEWDKARKAGIVFDRPRLAGILPKVPRKGTNGSCYEWTLTTMRTLKATAE